MGALYQLFACYFPPSYMEHTGICITKVLKIFWKYLPGRLKCLAFDSMDRNLVLLSSLFIIIGTAFGSESESASSFHPLSKLSATNPSHRGFADHISQSHLKQYSRYVGKPAEWLNAKDIGEFEVPCFQVTEQVD